MTQEDKFQILMVAIDLAKTEKEYPTSTESLMALTDKWFKYLIDRIGQEKKNG